MQICENVIVSIQIQQEEIDMELPAFLPIKELKEKLSETLQVMRPQLCLETRKLALSFDGHLLDEGKNLAYYGIWDGSRIACLLEKEGKK